MNNKGFGLQELLVFIGIFLFALVAAVIYWNAKIGNESFYDEPDVEVEKQDSIEETEPTKLEVPTEYMRLQNNLKNAAKNYSIDKKENVIITLKQLQNSNLIDKIVDPNNNTECSGYVVYTVNNDKYTAYINCQGFTSEAYDSLLDN